MSRVPLSWLILILGTGLLCAADDNSVQGAKAESRASCDFPGVVVVTHATEAALAGCLEIKADTLWIDPQQADPTVLSSALGTLTSVVGWLRIGKALGEEEIPPTPDKPVNRERPHTKLTDVTFLSALKSVGGLNIENVLIEDSTGFQHLESIGDVQGGLTVGIFLPPEPPPVEVDEKKELLMLEEMAVEAMQDQEQQQQMYGKADGLGDVVARALRRPRPSSASSFRAASKRRAAHKVKAPSTILSFPGLTHVAGPMVVVGNDVALDVSFAPNLDNPQDWGVHLYGAELVNGAAMEALTRMHSIVLADEAQFLLSNWKNIEELEKLVIWNVAAAVDMTEFSALRRVGGGADNAFFYEPFATFEYLSGNSSGHIFEHEEERPWDIRLGQLPALTELALPTLNHTGSLYVEDTATLTTLALPKLTHLDALWLDVDTVPNLNGFLLTPGSGAGSSNGTGLDMGWLGITGHFDQLDAVTNLTAINFLYIGQTALTRLTAFNRLRTLNELVLDNNNKLTRVQLNVTGVMRTAIVMGDSIVSVSMPFVREVELLGVQSDSLVDLALCSLGCAEIVYVHLPLVPCASLNATIHYWQNDTTKVELFSCDANVTAPFVNGTTSPPLLCHGPPCGFNDSGTAPLPPPPVNGAWGSWSDCTHHCGGGMRVRVCENQVGSGAGCNGTGVQACNTQACPSTEEPWSPCGNLRNVFGNPPKVKTHFTYSCPRNCPGGGKYTPWPEGGGLHEWHAMDSEWYAVNSEICAVAFHTTGIKEGTFNVKVQANLVPPVKAAGSSPVAGAKAVPHPDSPVVFRVVGAVPALGVHAEATARFAQKEEAIENEAAVVAALQRLWTSEAHPAAAAAAPAHAKANANLRQQFKSRASRPEKQLHPKH